MGNQQKQEKQVTGIFLVGMGTDIQNKLITQR